MQLLEQVSNSLSLGHAAVWCCLCLASLPQQPGCLVASGNASYYVQVAAADDMQPTDARIAMCLICRRTSWRCFLAAVCATFTLSQLSRNAQHGMIGFTGVHNYENRDWLTQLPFILINAGQ